MKRKFVTILVLITILAMVFPTFGMGSAAAEGDRVDFWLTVLHNNDGESQVINAGTGLEDFGGAARFESGTSASAP